MPNGDKLVEGTSGNDVLNGAGGNDYIYGYEGDDVLYGRRGNDVLFGGEGNDTLLSSTGIDFMYGGEGADIFVFNNQNKWGGYDIVNDFDFSEGDSLVIDGVTISDETDLVAFDAQVEWHVRFEAYGVFIENVVTGYGILLEDYVI